MDNHRSAPRSTPPPSSREEAAAIVAAVERFRRATAVQAISPPQGGTPWQRAALLEGVEREPRADVTHPWINT